MNFMLLKKNILLLILVLCGGTTFAQTVKGVVLNATTTQPVEGVAVRGDGPNMTDVTNSNGEFEIEAENFPISLRFSALGFEDRQIEFEGSEENITVFLTPFSEALSEVVIKSLLIPREWRKIPAAVTFISSEELQRIDETNLAQVLNFVPGVYVNQGALNTTRINIRGIGARSQYSTNRIQAYFEGIPLTTAEGELTLDDIDPESLSSIEVIKGPASSIYGAGLGGAINLYAATPEGNTTRASVNTLFGSFGTLKKSVSASHGTPTTSIFANFNDLQTDGYRENGEYSRKSALVNASLSTRDGNSLSFLANFTKLKAFIPSSINEEDFRNNPSVADANWAKSRGFESYDRGLLGLSYTHNIADSFTNTTSTFISFRDAYEPRPFDILKEETVSAGARTRFNGNFDLLDLPSQVSFGAEYYKEWYETGTFENLFRQFEDQGSVLGQRLSNNEQDRNYTNLFAQLSIEPSEKLNVEAGFNLNFTNYSLTDLFVQDEIDQSGDYGFENIFSPRIGATYEVGSGKSLYTSISHGFSTPTVAETLTPQGQINTDLQPETGINYEIGFKGNWLNNALYTEVALYSIQIDDLLVAQRVAEDRYVGLNAGKTDHNGVELFLNYSITLYSEVRLKPYLNASFNFFKFDEFENRDMDFSGNYLPGVPRNTVNAGIDMAIGRSFNFYSNFLAVGEIPLNDANSKFADSYNVLNLKATYDLMLLEELDLQFSAGINNVLDEHYAASVLPNAVGFGGAAPRYFYPGNPRNYFVGVGLNYVF